MNKKVLLLFSIVLLVSASAFSNQGMQIGHPFNPDSISTAASNEKSYPLVSVSPNPANGIINVSYKVPAASMVSVSVFNILGKEILPLFKGTQQAGSYQKQFTLNSDLDAGVYFVKVTTVNREFITKLIVQ